MKLLYKSKETISKRDIYKMTQDAGIKMMKDVEANAVIAVCLYVYYEDTNNKNETSQILSIMGDNGEVWSTTSKTFQRSFNAIVDIMEDEPFSIMKKEGVTKAGRPYVDCALV